jgi:hypothetical protein
MPTTRSVLSQYPRPSKHLVNHRGVIRMRLPVVPGAADASAAPLRRSQAVALLDWTSIPDDVRGLKFVEYRCACG